jgi:hypothetical protein
MKNVWRNVVHGGIFAWICFGLLVQSVLNLVANLYVFASSVIDECVRMAVVNSATYTNGNPVNN